MPFVHWDTLSHLERQQTALDLFLTNSVPHSIRRKYDDAALNPATQYTNFSVTSRKSLHPPRTLDQYQYPSLALSRDRLKNQVVPRQTRESDSGTRALVVHELWLIAFNGSRSTDMVLNVEMLIR